MRKIQTFKKDPTQAPAKNTHIAKVCRLGIELLKLFSSNYFASR